MAVCYRHPSRETGVSCSSCGRPICPDCMTPTSVGMRCPECAREKTKVRKLRAHRTPGTSSGGVTVTQILIGINVLVFLLETAAGVPLGGVSGGTNAGTIWYHGVLFGPAVAAQGPFHTHEVWRLITAGFLHDGLLHILFNMWFLFIIGPMLEPAIGKLNFTVVYFVSLLAGSFGALLFQPDVPTVGASTACFGLLGALIVVAYYRGISIWQSGLGLTLVINIIFTLSVTGISLGGHLGGLVGGAICGWLIVQFGERRNMEWAALTGCALVAIVSVIGALAVAGGTGLTPNGISLF